METNLQISQIKRLAIFALLLFFASESYSQQLIRFKDGTELKVFITSLSKDTIRYYLDGRPEIVYIDKMANVSKIEPVRSESLVNSLRYDETYMHYKRSTTTGVALLSTGAVIGIIGVAGYTSIEDHVEDVDAFTGTVFSVIGMMAGTALFVSGTIIAIVGSANMQAYKQKLHGFSFDLKCTPQQKGLAVVYRF